jgi:hypothetical protein
MKADTTKHHCDYRIEKEYNTTTVHSDMNAAMRQRYEATFLPYFLKVFLASPGPTHVVFVLLSTRWGITP